MAKKLISILGIGDYNKSKHYYKGNYIDTNEYAQLVLYEIYCHDFGKDDKYVVFMTNESKEKHWDTTLGPAFEKLDKNNTLTLEAIVLDYKDENYTKNLYTSIIDVIDEGDSVILDITHGFRSYSILVASILDYVRVVKDVTVTNIVYAENNPESKVTEIKELSALLDMELWSNYVDIFLKTGNASYLTKLVETDKAYSFINRDGYENTYLKLLNLSSGLNWLFEAVAICDTTKIIERVKELYKDYQVQSLKEIQNNFAFYPFVYLFEKVSKKIEDLYNQRDELLILNVIEHYCLEFGQIQQGYTLLKELIITDAGKKLRMDINDRETREGKCFSVNSILYEMGNRKKAEENFIAKYESEAQKLEYVYRGMGTKVAEIYDTVGQLRNQINHAGFSQKKHFKYKNLTKVLQEHVSTLREIYSKDSDSQK